MASLGILGALGGLGQAATQLGTLSMQSQIEEQRQVAADARAMRLEKYRSEQNRADDTWKLDEADRRDAAKEKEIGAIVNPVMSDEPTISKTPATNAVTPSGDMANPALKSDYNPNNGETVTTPAKIRTTYEKAISAGDALTKVGKVKEAKQYYDIAKELKPAADKFIAIGDNGIYDTQNNKVVVPAQPKKLSGDEQALRDWVDAHPDKNYFDAKVALAVAGRTPAQAREIPLDKQGAAAWLRKHPNQDISDYIDREKPNGNKGEKESVGYGLLKSMLQQDPMGGMSADNANLYAEILPIYDQYIAAGYSVPQATSMAYKDVQDTKNSAGETVKGKRAARQPITTSKPNVPAKQSDVRSKADKILGL